MSLVANYSSSSSDESENETGKIEEPNHSSSTLTSSEEESEPEINKLPLPTAIFKQKGEHKLPRLNVTKRKLSQNSIFSDPFAQSNATMEHTLSKHKQLAETKDQEPNKRQRKKQAKESEAKRTKLCVHFFKHGTCKYADNCKFAHKLLNQPEQAVEFKEPDIVSEPDVIVKKKKKRNNFIASMTDPNSDDEGSSINKKKRLGLGNNLVPGKKVLHNYDKLCK